MRLGKMGGDLGWRWSTVGARSPCEPRRPSACTSHPVAGQRLRRTFLQQARFHAFPLLCAFAREPDMRAARLIRSVTFLAPPVHRAVEVDPVVRGFKMSAGILLLKRREGFRSPAAVYLMPLLSGPRTAAESCQMMRWDSVSFWSPPTHTHL